MKGFDYFRVDVVQRIALLVGIICLCVIVYMFRSGESEVVPVQDAQAVDGEGAGVRANQLSRYGNVLPPVYTEPAPSERKPVEERVNRHVGRVAHLSVDEGESVE